MGGSFKTEQNGMKMRRISKTPRFPVLPREVEGQRGLGVVEKGAQTGVEDRVCGLTETEVKRLR